MSRLDPRSRKARRFAKRKAAKPPSSVRSTMAQPSEVANMLEMFINIKNWDEAYALLERKQGLLLTDIATRILTVKIEEARQNSDKDLEKSLLLYLKLVNDAREKGVGTAWETFMAKIRHTEQYRQTYSSTLGEFVRFTQEEAEHALNDMAFLAEKLGLPSDNPDLLAYQEQIRNTIEQGKPDKDPLAQLVLDWLNMPTYSEQRLFLETHPELLDSGSDTWLMRLIADHTGHTEEEVLRSYLLLLHNARSMGIGMAWARFVEDLQLTLTSKLHSEFQEWLEMPHRREERRYLETHLELLHPVIDAMLEKLVVITMEEAKTQKNANDVIYQQNAKRFVVDTHDHQSLLRDVRKRGGSVQDVRDAYVNAYGGFVLDVPAWLQACEQQSNKMLQLGRLDESAPARTALWRDALARVQRGKSIAPEIVAAIRFQIWDALGDMADVDDIQMKQIGLVSLEEALHVYSRERYPHLWANIQHNLGLTYQNLLHDGNPNNLDRAIAYYKAHELRNEVVEEFAPDLVSENDIARVSACLKLSRNRRVEAKPVAGERKSWEKKPCGPTRSSKPARGTGTSRQQIATFTPSPGRARWRSLLGRRTV